MRRAESRAHRAVLIGYGPTGRTVARMLKENGIEPTVIEINIETIRELREHGVDAVYGDATRPETLVEAGIASADNLILTSAGMANSEEVIRAAREANPKVRVLARASYLRDLPGLKRAGATPCLRVKAKWRWPSSKRCSSASARRPSRSTASATAPTPSCSAMAQTPLRHTTVESAPVRIRNTGRHESVRSERNQLELVRFIPAARHQHLAPAVAIAIEDVQHQAIQLR